MKVTKTLEERITALEDIEAIKNLKHKYFRCLDRRLWDEIGDCFTVDAYGDYNKKILNGREALASSFKDGIAPNYKVLVHQGHNPEIALVSKTKATGYWELESFLTANNDTGLQIVAIYEDEYQKQSGKWRMSKTIVTYVFKKTVEVGWNK
jgi:bile-acid 7alpha-dehydratase